MRAAVLNDSLRQIDNAADKLIEGVGVHKDFNNPALLNLPDAHSRVSQLFATEVKELVAGMEIENGLQGFTVVAIFLKTTVVHNPVDLFPQNGNAPRAVGVEL